MRAGLDLSTPICSRSLAREVLAAPNLDATDSDGVFEPIVASQDRLQLAELLALRGRAENHEGRAGPLEVVEQPIRQLGFDEAPARGSARLRVARPRAPARLRASPRRRASVPWWLGRLRGRLGRLFLASTGQPITGERKRATEHEWGEAARSHRVRGYTAADIGDGNRPRRPGAFDYHVSHDRCIDECEFSVAESGGRQDGKYNRNVTDGRAVI